MSLEADWLHSDDVDTLYASSDAPVASSSSLAAVQKAAAQIDRAELMKRKVIAPVPSEGPPKPCGICKEAFKSEWSESDEEWMFYNAEKVDGVVRPLSTSSRFNLTDMLVSDLPCDVSRLCTRVSTT
jgi:hypothetical protein